MSITVKKKAQFTTGKTGQKVIRKNEGPAKPEKRAANRIPRVSRLMALAIHFDGLIGRGVVRDYADLARLGGITRARVTQIMNLLNLAPIIQEKLLFLHGADSGREAVTEKTLRPFVAKLEWHEQIYDLAQVPLSACE